MRLRHLEIVWAIARGRSMREAARLLGISQPAMSQGLKRAEDLLGFELFHRQGGRLAPTPELRALMPDMEHIFTRVAEIRTRSLTMSRGQFGELSIVTIPALAGDWLAHAAMAFRRMHPRIALQVVSIPARGVIDRVLSHQAEIGLLHGPIAVQGLEVMKLAENVVVAVLHRDHPLADRRAVSVKDLASFEVISLGRGNAPGDLIMAAFRRANVPFAAAVEITTSSAAIAFVRAGVGVALIDARTAGTFVFEDIVVRQFLPRIVLDAAAVMAVDRALPHSASAFVGILRETVLGHYSAASASEPQSR